MLHPQPLLTALTPRPGAGVWWVSLGPWSIRPLRIESVVDSDIAVQLAVRGIQKIIYDLYDGFSGKFIDQREPKPAPVSADTGSQEFQYPNINVCLANSADEMFGKYELRTSY